MDIRHFKVDDKTRRELEAAELECRDVRERRRLQGVRLYVTGEKVETILKVVQTSVSSLGRWVSRYRKKGLAGLRASLTVGNHRCLKVGERAEVVRLLSEETPPTLGLSGGAYWQVGTVRQLVRQRYGVEYATPSSYRALLHEAGLSYQRVAKVYRHHPSPLAVSEWEAQAEKK